MGLFGSDATPTRAADPEDLVDEIQIESSLIVLTHPDGINILKELGGGAKLVAIQDKEGMDVWQEGSPQNEQERGFKTYVLKYERPIDISAFNVKLKASRLTYSIREVSKTKESEEEAKERKRAARKAAAPARAARAPAVPAAPVVLPPKEEAPKLYPKIPGEVIDVDPRNFQGVETPGVYQIFTNKNGAQFANFTVKPKFGLGTYKKKRVYGNPVQIRAAVEGASGGVTIQQLNAAGEKVEKQIETLETKQEEFKNATQKTSQSMQAATSTEEAAAVTKRLEYLTGQLDILEKMLQGKKRTLDRIKERKAEVSAGVATPPAAGGGKRQHRRTRQIRRRY